MDLCLLTWFRNDGYVTGPAKFHAPVVFPSDFWGLVPYTIAGVIL